jgi:hypothetical protein
MSCNENGRKGAVAIINATWRTLIRAAKFIIFAESGGIAIYMMASAEYANNLKGMIDAAKDILLLSFTILVWFPRVFAPAFWRDNKVLRRTLLVCLSIILVCLESISRIYFKKSELLGQMFISFGPMSLTILALKWWWDDKDECLIYDILMFILIGFFVFFINII